MGHRRGIADFQRQTKRDGKRETVKHKGMGGVRDVSAVVITPLISGRLKDYEPFASNPATSYRHSENIETGLHTFLQVTLASDSHTRSKEQAQRGIMICPLHPETHHHQACGIHRSKMLR